MNIIRLGKNQKKYMKVEHPLFQDLQRPTESEVIQLRESGDHEALTMSLLLVVKTIVGRFKYHWPASRRFEEDMVSAGLVGLMKIVNNDSIDSLVFFPACWVSVQREIENMMNDSRSLFGASWATNCDRTKNGQEPEYNFVGQFNEEIHEDHMDVGQEWVDMMDEIESLQEQDKEHMRFLILRHMRDECGIDEDSLTDEELAAVEATSQIFENL